MPPTRSQANREIKDSATTELKKIRENELAVKRMAGHISCAECCRLKIRCNKKIPCNTCVRRGCQSICPLNTNADPDAHISPPVPQLSTQKLMDRISALEDALQISTNGDHPLLAQEFLVTNKDSTPELVDGDSPESSTSGANGEVLAEDFGHLSITQGKKMHFLGVTAVESTLLQKLIESEDEVRFEAGSNDRPYLSSMLAQADLAFPFSPSETMSLSQCSEIVSYLPDHAAALRLAESFSFMFGWVNLPIDSNQIHQELLPTFYPDSQRLDPGRANNTIMDDLALLYAVFAIGCDATIMQLGKPSELCEQYKCLSRAALAASRGIMENGSLSVTQTLSLLSTFEIYSWRPTSQETAWRLKSIGLFIASSLGLHRDPVRWNLDPIVADRRRRTFWELNASSVWKCLGTGRPSLFSPEVIDCEFPEDTSKLTDEDGNVYEGTRHWQYRFARDLLPKLIDKFCSARSIKYSEILELDRAIRDFPLHPMADRILTSARFPDNMKALYPLKCLLWREIATQVVHRNFFARTILEKPDDPQSSPYVPSFLATYRSAITILKVLRAMSKAMPGVLQRVHSYWSASLASVVIIGSIASRVTNSIFSAPALDELNAVIPVFEQCQIHPIPRAAMKILYKMRDRAYASRGTMSNGAPEVSSLNENPTASEINDDDDDELLIMRGTLRKNGQTPTNPLSEKKLPSFDKSHTEKLAKSGFFHVEDLSSQSAFFLNPPGVTRSKKDQNAPREAFDILPTSGNTDSGSSSSSPYIPSEAASIPSNPPPPVSEEPVQLNELNVLFGSMPYTTAPPTTDDSLQSILDLNIDSNILNMPFDPSTLDFNMDSFMDIDGSLGGQTAAAWQAFMDESGVAPTTEDGMQSFNGYNTWEDLSFILN